MTKKEQKFVATVWEFYRLSGRHTLPWRKTTNPYRILVSEIMLQQTQVVRVLPKYLAFLKKFPTVETLAAASLGDVLILWQGLGYNRRAKLLKKCAETIVATYQGRFPKTYVELLSLPGVGPYTAGAVMAFAYNQAVPIIETNIRSVYLNHFFEARDKVTDVEIMYYIQRTLPTENPRGWYAALMDYGSHLKLIKGNVSQRSASYVKQSQFAGSDRQVRGMVLRMLSTVDTATEYELVRFLPTACTRAQLRTQLRALLTEQLIVSMRRRYSLPRIV